MASVADANGFVYEHVHGSGPKIKFEPWSGGSSKRIEVIWNELSVAGVWATSCDDDQRVCFPHENGGLAAQSVAIDRICGCCSFIICSILPLVHYVVG